MMNMMMTSMNMATMMAEDAGAAELRNPLNSGMRSGSKGIIHRLFGRKKESGSALETLLRQRFFIRR